MMTSHPSSIHPVPMWLARRGPILGALLLLSGLVWGSPGVAGTTPSPDEILPPVLPWDGASRSLVVAEDHPWITPAEVAGLETTPSYEETVAWLERLVAASPRLAMVSIGTSHQGRAIPMIVASAGGGSTAAALRATGRPLVLAHGGIHSGEIDGKDAGLMLLRDLIADGRRGELLERVNLLFIPILNVDGHERTSPFNRANQRGPRSMGWRTNARNQNLNRDFAKLDTPAVRALIAVVEEWRPDLYLDLHVTDGADYQYDITWGYTGPHGLSPAGAGWLKRRFDPHVTRRLKEMGHIPGPLVFLADSRDPSKGNVDWTAGPRYSNGYGDARHLPTVLLENHSLKPYDQRVLGTYVFVEAALEAAAEHGAELRRAVQEDRSRRRDPVPLAFGPSTEPPPTVEFLGIESTLTPSEISGGQRLAWTGKPVTLEIPFIPLNRPTIEMSRPVAYWVPPSWPEVIERLELHGIRVERQRQPRELEVEMYRLGEPSLDGGFFEGRLRVTAEASAERRRESFPPGSVRVPLDQPLGSLAMLLLEPASPDSFFQWGFFLEVLQRTEYMESYVAEPMAELMLRRDPELAAEFQRQLAAEPELAADPRQRLQWFHRRSEYWDERWRLYPVARELPAASDP